MQIVLFGSSDFSIPTLKYLHKSNNQLVAVVTPFDKPKGRGKKLYPSKFSKYAMDKGYPIIQIENFKDSKIQSRLQKLNADIFVVVAFQKIPDHILKIPKICSMNIHPSLLPKYRGAAPLQWAIINGEKKIGISIIKLSSQIDAGNILKQKIIDFKDEENFGDLYEKTSNIGAKLLLKTIDVVKQDNLYIGLEQNNELATAARKLRKKDFLINWFETCADIRNKVRAFSPYPGAYTHLENKRLKIFEVEYYECNNEKIKPGSFFIKENSLIVSTSDGFLSILNLQLEGKNRLTTKDFLSGNKFSTYKFG